MPSFKSLLVSTALLVSVIADNVAFTEWPTSLTAGQPSTLKWAGGSGAPATITLRKGSSNDLKDVQVLTSDARNGEFTWTPGADLRDGSDYAFQINQGDEVNYTGQLQLSGGSGATPTVPEPMPFQPPQVTDAVDSTSASASASSDLLPSSSDVAAQASSASASVRLSSSPASRHLTPTPSKGSPTHYPNASSTTAQISMKTHFIGTRPTSTASASLSAQTGAAGHVDTPLIFSLGSVALFVFLQ